MSKIEVEDTATLQLGVIPHDYQEIEALGTILSSVNTTLPGGTTGTGPFRSMGQAVTVDFRGVNTTAPMFTRMGIESSNGTRVWTTVGGSVRALYGGNWRVIFQNIAGVGSPHLALTGSYMVDFNTGWSLELE